jgi:hypothetical protein
MMPRTPRFPTVALLLLASCGPREVAPPVSAPRAWDVGPDMAWPLRYGMSAHDAAIAAGAASPAPPDTGCAFWVPAGAPAGLRFMIENGVLVRADVDSAGVPTLQGVQVGSSVDSVIAAFGEQLQVSPHKYQWESGWKYLTVAPDSMHRVVFEVDSHSVRTYRAGLLPAVEYVEGCS